jgi:hypothetical protein
LSLWLCPKASLNVPLKTFQWHVLFNLQLYFDQNTSSRSYFQISYNFIFFSLQVNTIYLTTFFGDVPALYQWLLIVHQNHSRSLFIIIEEKCIWIEYDHLTSFQHFNKIICTFRPLSVGFIFLQTRIIGHLYNIVMMQTFMITWSQYNQVLMINFCQFVFWIRQTNREIGKNK